MKTIAPKYHGLYRLTLPLLLVMGCEDRPLPQRVKTYDKQQIISYLRAWGIEEDTFYNYWQNSQGDALYIPLPNVSKIALISSRLWKPQLINFPAKRWPYWIDSQGKLHFVPSFALNERDPDIVTAVDNQSGFFLQRHRSMNEDIFYVGRMADTKGWLIVGHDTKHFVPDQVCARGDTLYLQDNSDASSGTPFFDPHKNCWAYRRNSRNQYVKVDEFRINGQIFNVDPFRPRVFCAGYGSMPFTTPDFLFDLDKHEEIRPLMTEKIVLFLASDWLGPRLSEKPGGK